jgi:hypothetical protein
VRALSVVSEGVVRYRFRWWHFIALVVVSAVVRSFVYGHVPWGH